MTQENLAATTNQTDDQNGFLASRPQIAIGLGVLIIVAGTVLAYLPAMWAGFIWDDDYYVRDNSLLRSWEGLQQIWTDVFPDPALYPLPQYYPMTHTSFWLEYRLYGDNPAGYHADNIALHILDALLIWLILRKLDVPGAWLAAAIFALHPINVESAAWIAERKNVLCLLFFLSSLYVYLRFAGIIAGAPVRPVEAPKTPESDVEGEPIIWARLPDDPMRLYGLAIVLFLCALFSKTITNSLPAVVLLIIWWKRGRITIKDALPLLPFFAAGIAIGALTAHMEVVRVGVGLRPGPWHYSDSALGQFAARCIIAGHALWFYVGKLILPYPLIFNYPRWDIDPANPLQYFFPITAAGAVIAVALSHKRLGRGPVVAVLYYVGTLFPALGFFNVWPMQYSFVADHFAYLSLIGLIALAAGLARKHLDRWLLAGIGGAVLCVLGMATFFQAGVYTDLNSLWRDTLVKTNQKSWFALNNYAAWILTDSRIQNPQTRLDEAEKRFLKVISLKRDHAEARRNLAKIAEARAFLAQQAIAAGEHPTTQPAEYYQQAIDYYRDAIKCYDGFIQARFDLAKRLQAMGKTDEAIEQFQEILKRNPREISTHRELARIALQKEQLDEAIKRYQIVVDLQPKSALAHADLGDALLQQGKTVEGLGEWAQARSLEPGNISWPIHFGVRMAESGKYSQAVAYFRDALKIDPQSAEALTNMGIVAALTGFPKEARANLEQALKVSPGFAKAKESLEALESGKLGPATTRPTTGPGVLSN